MRTRRTSGAPRSDDCRHSRGDDRNAGADTDADANGQSDLAEAEAARGHAGEAERERDDRDDLAARTFEERGELVERGIEGRIGAGKGRTRKQNEGEERYRCEKRKILATEQPPVFRQ